MTFRGFLQEIPPIVKRAAQAIAAAAIRLRVNKIPGLPSARRRLTEIWHRLAPALDALTQRLRSETLTLSVESGQIRAVIFHGSKEFVS